MTKIIQFVKMQGAGNDYIYIDTMRYNITNPQELAMKLSLPHTGIGSDGLVLIGASHIADFSMRIFNSDGSEAMMCGNASRCIGKYLYEYGKTDKTNIKLETLSGIKLLKLNVVDNKVEKVTVDMGKPTFEPLNFIMDKKNMILRPIRIDNTEYIGTAVSMGNPHFVIFVDDVEHIPLSEIGPRLEYNPIFSDRSNIEFAQLLNNNKIRTRVWERGSGITMACGTGACATAAAAIFNNKIKREKEIDIIMDGGTLSIIWDKKTNHILMNGPTTIVFEGKIAIED